MSTNISSSGTPVEILMRMPEEIVGKPSRAWLCRGRIARVQEYLSGDHVEIGIQSITTTSSTSAGPGNLPVSDTNFPRALTRLVSM